MTDHPAKGMTKAQREAFENIAVNQLPRCTHRTLEALTAAGIVVVSYRRRRDALGPYEIPDYSVPFDIHRQWCEWCSEQPDTVVS